MSDKKKSVWHRILQVFPGLAVCIAIAIASKVLARFLPSLGAATISIFLGILIGNTIGKAECLKKGTKFSESTLLSISVVLLGATLSFQTLLHLGVRGLLFILIQMTVTVIFVLLIGRVMKFGTDFILLMASGNSVCGSSAIASTAPVIHAHSKEKGIAITMVNVTGTILMILLPLLTTVLYGNELVKSSAMIGGILQSVGQVVASASMVNDEVKELATIFKIVRIIFLIVVVFALAAIKNHSTKGGIDAVEEEIHSHTHQSRIKVPWYIIGFFITCILYTLGIIPAAWTKDLKDADNFIEIVALAGIGMRVYFNDLVKQGVKVSLYCAAIATFQIISSVLLIWLII